MKQFNNLAKFMIKKWHKLGSLPASETQASKKKKRAKKQSKERIESTPVTLDPQWYRLYKAVDLSG